MKSHHYLVGLFVIIGLLLFLNAANPVLASGEKQKVISGEAAAIEFGLDSPAYTGCGGVNVSVVNAAYEQEVVYLVNQERTNVGLPPLKQSVELDEAARYHAADMSQDNYFKHDSYDQAGDEVVYVCSTWDRIKTYYPSPRAENIAAGYSTPASVMNGWMNSPGHKNNILGAASWEIGVGYFQGGSWGSYWVQDFGHRSGVYPLIIDQDSGSTDSPSVSLYIYGDWIEIRLRNDNGEWTTWMPFQNNMNWELAGGAGMQTVWAEMRTPSESSSTSDTITLTVDDSPPTPTPTVTPTSTPTTIPTIYTEFLFIPHVLNKNP